MVDVLVHDQNPLEDVTSFEDHTKLQQYRMPESVWAKPPARSYDIYFAPKPLAGKAGNWLQTIPEKSWFVALRMYGPLQTWIDQAWIDQTWRPGEIELVE